MAFNGEIFEIFSWLSAKIIFKFCSICKVCNQFVSEDFFIKKQCKNMLSMNEFGFFIQPNSYQAYKDKLEFHTLPGEEHWVGVPRKCLQFLNTTGRLLASCNGLLCCRNISKRLNELFVCNPATQRQLLIPLPESLKDANRHFRIVFYCNTDSFDYLLMTTEGTEHWSSDIIFKVYLVQEGTWKEKGLINCGARDINFDSPVYYHGALHFLSNWFPFLVRNTRFYWPYLVAFDMKTGMSKFLQVPRDARKGLRDPSCKMGIFDWKKGNAICLGKLLKNVFTIWILSDYYSERWTKFLKVRARAMGMIEHNPKVAGFIIINGDSLLVATDKRVYQYKLVDDWRKRKAKRICGHECGDNILLHSYSSTLRPCGNKATSLPM